MGLGRVITSACVILTIAWPVVRGEENCSHALGMADGGITNSQISCWPTGSCHNARLNNERGRGWIGYTQSRTTYSQVDLQNQKQITKVTVQGSTSGYFTKSFRVYYSRDGIVWEVYRPLAHSSFLGAELPANSDRDTIVEQHFDPPIVARFIALNPLTWQGYPTLRYELFGCDVNPQTRTRFTNITADVENDDVLFTSLSPYMIDREVVIRFGSTLTVQRGVRVIATSSAARFLVQGRMVVEGGGSVQTVFSHSSLPLNRPDGKWGGILVSKEGELVFSNADVWQATVGVTGAAEDMRLTNLGVYMSDVGLRLTSGRTNRTEPAFTGGNIHLCSYGVEMSTVPGRPYFSFESYNVVHNEQSGFVTRNPGSGLILRNSVISRNGGNGIYSSYRMKQISFHNIMVESNRGYGIIVSQLLDDSEMSSSTLRSNGNYGGYFSADRYKSLNVYNSMFDSNRYGGLRILAWNTKVEGNVFTGNQAGYALQVNEYSSQDTGLKNVANNTFDENFGGVYISSNSPVTFSGNKLFGTRGSTAAQINAINVVFTDNVIENSTSSTALLLLKPPINTLSYNVFNNPSSDYEIKTSSDENSVAPQIVNLAYNYWGSTNVTYIFGRMYDFFVDMYYVPSLWSPFYLDRDLTSLYNGPDPRIFTVDQDNGIGGLVYQDITLTNGTYVVKKSVYVSNDISLTVLAGVRLSFSRNTGIFVNGSVFVRGEEEAVVSLTGLDDETWAGILYNNTDVHLSNVELSGLRNKALKFVDTTSVTMSNVRLSGGDYGIEATLQRPCVMRLNNVSFTPRSYGIYINLRTGAELDFGVENSKFYSYRGIYLSAEYSRRTYDRSVRILARNSIFRCRYYGIQVSQSYRFKAAVWVQDSQFSDSNECVYLRMEYSDVSVSNCVFRRCNRPIYMSFSEVCQDTSINNNDFIDSGSSNIVYLYSSFSRNTNNCSLEISNNSLDNLSGRKPNNNFDGLYLNSGYEQLRIEQNSISQVGDLALEINMQTRNTKVSVTGNSISDCGRALILRARHPNGQIMITENKILRNFGENIVELLPHAQQSSPFVFSSNVLENNTHTVVKISVPILQLHRNVFDNPESDYNVLLTESGYSDREVNATLNYWGELDSREISRKIFDQRSDTSLPLIVFEPYYENHSLEGLYEEEVVFLTDGRVGGSVNGHVFLTLAGGPYTAIGNIQVGDNDTLEIEAGVVIYFLANTRLSVTGTLIAAGNSTHPISLLPKTPGNKWIGVDFEEPYWLRGTRSSDIRLANGPSEREGRVEVRYKGQFGTVCDDGFDENDARVVCRMLGYDPTGRVTVLSSATYGRGEGQIWLDDLGCSGQETDLSACNSQGLGSHNCNHGEDVGVRCYGTRIGVSEIAGLSSSRLGYLYLNDTVTGLKVLKNLPKMDHISVYFSAENGFSFYSTESTDSEWVKNITSVAAGISGIHMQDAELHITGCKMEQNVQNGLLVKSYGNLILSECEISQTKTGIKLEEVYSGSLRVRASEFLALSEHLLSEPQWSRSQANIDFSMSLSDSVVSRCSTRYYRWGWRYLSLIDIQGNYNARTRSSQWNFFGNNFYNITAERLLYVETSQRHTSILTFHKNNVSDSYMEALYLILNSDNTSVDISANSFINITSQANRPIIHIRRLNPGRNSIVANNNIFQLNKGSSVINLEGDPIEHSGIDIAENDFINNTATDVIKSEVFGLSAQRNIFNNPHADCEFRAPTFLDLKPIDSKYSFWGFEDVGRIVERICSFDKDMRLGRVSVIPYLLSSERDDVIGLLPGGNTFYLDAAAGGDVTEHMTISSPGLPLVIQRSIYVHEDVLLHIEPGTTLEFFSNRGIFIKGDSVIGSDGELRTLLRPHNSTVWQGIQFAAPSKRKSQVAVVSEIKKVTIEQSVTGLTIERSIISLYDNFVFQTDKDGITIRTSDADINFNGTVVQGCTSGIYATGSSNLQLRNVTLLDCRDHGAFLDSATGSISMDNVVVNNTRLSGIRVNFNRDYNTQRVSVVNSKISHSRDAAINLYLSSYVTAELDVSRNSIENSSQGFVLRVQPYSYRQGSNRTCHISDNVIRRCGQSSLVIYSFSETRLWNNQFLDGNTFDSCALTVQYANSHGYTSTIDLSINRFESLTGKCAVELITEDDRMTGTFIYNHISNCQSNEAALVLRSSKYNVTENIFDNPQTPYEVKVTMSRSGSVSAQSNWWGGTDIDFARRRVYDAADDPSLLRLDIEPIKLELGFVCTGVNNCSDRGECVRPNGCRCNTGWAGKSCLQYDCAGVNNCFQRGNCIGPNTCDCNVGYKGSRCELATCSNVDDCSGRGFCVAPDECRCFTEYSGPACLDCAPGRWGEDCLSCPFCVQPQGSCNVTDGTCSCATDNWTGERCERCAETFYGPRCEPWVTVLNVFPNAGPDTGGTEVHVRGHNFPATVNQTYFCRFGSVVVTGTRISREHVICFAPTLTKSRYRVEVSPDGKANFTTNKVQYTVYAECPPGACGKDLQPAHGSCAFGGCVCVRPWTGDNCLVELIAPKIAGIPDEVIVDEGDRVFLQLNLTAGSEPVVWSVRNAPQGLRLDVRTASLTWGRSVGSVQPYRVTVRATNIIGTDEKVFSVRVPLSYNVTIDSTAPEGILHSPQPVTIRGHVNFWRSTGPRVVLVDLWINRYDGEKKISVKTLPTFTNPLVPGYFEAVFAHQPSEYGRFVVSGNHPSDRTFRAQAEWSLQGMRCSKDYILLRTFLDTPPYVQFLDVARLLNVGPYAVGAVRTEVQGVGSLLTAVSIVNNSTGEETPEFAGNIQPGEDVTFAVLMTALGPLRGTIGVTFTSELGTSTSCRLRVELNTRRPHFTLSPRTLRDNVLIGSQKNYQIEIINDGQAVANNVLIDLPNDPRISVVALTAVQNELSSDVDGQVNLAPSESAILTLGITSPRSDSLGEMQGRIAINSAGASATLSYHFILVSDNRLNFTVLVEDEFTYFDENHPLVAGARVTLYSGRRSYREVLETSDTGFVTFNGIYEDKYNLYVEAEGHASYAAVIVATGSSPEERVFLERIAVKVTWSVTPTTFQDKYVVTLETTFVAQVPMPVVTVEPSKVNTIPYEEGREDTIEFLVTNHGLIRADNVRLALPDSHPSLVFYHPENGIGHLVANTSVVVLVRVERKLPVVIETTSSISTTRDPGGPGQNTDRVGGNTPRGTTRDKRLTTIAPKTTTRSSGPTGGSSGTGETSGSFCAVLVVYDFVCGVRRTRQIVVSLTREYPGRPPLPCVVTTVTVNPYHSPGVGGVGGVGGPRRYTGGGGVVEYKPITPISCDCVKSFVKNCIPFGSCAVSALEASVIGILKDCVVPILPLSGCAKTLIQSALSTFSKNSFLSLISSAIDIAISCIVSTICPICEKIWTIIKCFVNVAIDCNLGGLRRKRDVTSAIVDNLVVKALPVNNYLDMMEGIFGDRSMLELKDNSWYGPFKSAVADDSPAGSLLTDGEYTAIWQRGNNTMEQEKIRAFLRRWNNTALAFKDGTLASRPASDNVIPFSDTTAKHKIFVQDNEDAIEAGFSSIFDEFDNAINVYIEAREQQPSGGDEGVCAKVRVRIVQDLVLTRDAFNARLEIENGEQSALTDIKVVIFISPSSSPGRNVTDQFAIGEAELVGITGVKGMGTLPRAVSGVAEWLIVPYPKAAVREDVQYDVGGSLSYSVGGSSLTVSLIPDTITVKPTPIIHVHYFHEKYVRGDDPFTDPVEPSVPFVLAVMITNAGYGIAKSVRLTSAEPEIVENEKGLLVSFQITGTAVNNEPVPRSLKIDFGDIDSFETKVARWFLTTSLKGLFYNFSATFENINPLGDPQLSILDVLKIHELIHLVRVWYPEDDGIDDFLVNDALDAGQMADHFYDSSNGMGTELRQAEITNFTEVSVQRRQSGTFTFVHMEVNVTEAGWFYVRREIGTLFPRLSDVRLLAVNSVLERTVLVGKNTWTTDYYNDAFYFHMFDYPLSNEPLQMYDVVFGPYNDFSPEFEQREYILELKFPLVAERRLGQVAADDEDGGSLSYSLVSEVFDIDSRTGEFWVTENVSDATQLQLVVVVTDDGIPARSSSANVIIKPLGSGVPTTRSSAPTRSSTATTTTFSSLLPNTSTVVSTTTRTESTISSKTTSSSVPLTTTAKFITTVATQRNATDGGNITDCDFNITGDGNCTSSSPKQIVSYHPTVVVMLIFMFLPLYLAN